MDLPFIDEQLSLLSHVKLILIISKLQLVLVLGAGFCIQHELKKDNGDPRWRQR